MLEKKYTILDNHVLTAMLVSNIKHYLRVMGMINNKHLLIHNALYLYSTNSTILASTRCRCRHSSSTSR